MKQVIIFLLVIIVGIMGYNMYSKYKRFHPPNYQYEPSQPVDESHLDKAMLLDYHEAVESLNGFVITQWSANGIDVRNPNDDDGQTKAAILEYGKKLAKVKFYELQLLQPHKEALLIEPSEEELKKQLILRMFESNRRSDGFRLGEKSALIYEVQRFLIKKGHSIKHDGLFRTETSNALKSFEESKGLFPDGKLDAITLDFLLR